MERRISRRFVTTAVVEVWLPKRGVLGRLKSAEFPAADLSQFGTSVIASKSDGLKRGQVVQVSVDGATCNAIVRNHFDIPDEKRKLRYGLEFIQPSTEFNAAITSIINTARTMSGESIVASDLWLRSA